MVKEIEMLHVDGRKADHARFDDSERAKPENRQRIHLPGSSSWMDEKRGGGECVTEISKVLEENRARIARLCRGCDDILLREMRLGNPGIDCLLVYIETAVSNMMLADSVLGKLLNCLWEMDEGGISRAMEENGLGIADVKEFSELEAALDAMLAGNAVLFLDGYEKALKIGSKGYPGLGVSKAESEKVLRGSHEAFGESVKLNTALIRKRIRTTGLKVEEYFVGVRSNTVTALVYLEDLVRPGLPVRVREELQAFSIDAVQDSGFIEQLAGRFSWSPFPKFQVTERPDRAAAAVLEGRMVLLCDNSPAALLLPTTLNSLMQTGDDYYGSFEIASFLRVIRYLSLALAFSLPGLYLAVTGFHPQLLPAALSLSLAQARSGVPFPGIVEVLFLEISFELLREAGLRMPGPIGGTIGIVGGLIVGQAAVSANLVSPVVVVVAAMTALGSFSIPNEELSEAMRLLKYGMILLCGYFGLYGFVFGWILLLVHLSRLKSFEIPYLMPFAARSEDGITPFTDGIFRGPLSWLAFRPVFTRSGARRRYVHFGEMSTDRRKYCRKNREQEKGCMPYAGLKNRENACRKDTGDGDGRTGHGCGKNQQDR